MSQLVPDGAPVFTKAPNIRCQSRSCRFFFMFDSQAPPGVRSEDRLWATTGCRMTRRPPDVRDGPTSITDSVAADRIGLRPGRRTHVHGRQGSPPAYIRQACRGAPGEPLRSLGKSAGISFWPSAARRGEGPLLGSFAVAHPAPLCSQGKEGLDEGIDRRRLHAVCSCNHMQEAEVPDACYR